ncbi:MAG TPA: hypothetical protein VGD49_08655 [Longimicrobiales bacterium]
MKKLFALTLVLLACESPTIPDRIAQDVYRYELPTPALRVLRWPVGKVVNVYVVGHTDAARTEALHAALSNAIEVWNAAVLFGEVQLRETSNVNEADALLNFSGTLLPVSVSDCPPGGSAAYTTFCLTVDQEHLKVFPLSGNDIGQVKFIVTVRTVTPLVPADVTRLVAHEMGHVLGLAQHSPLSTDLMHELAAVATRPTPRDRATLQALYHTPAEITP